MKEKETTRLTQHGTINGYGWHKRRKEDACQECTDAMREYWKEQRRVNGEHINKLRREWRFRTPNANRRFRRNSSEPGYYSDEDVLRLYGTDCHICGEPIDLQADRRTGYPGWERSLHIDHVFPLSKGGTDTLDNVKPAHGRCNIIKWATIPKESAIESKTGNNEPKTGDQNAIL